MKKPEPMRVVLSLRTRHQDAAERSLAEALAQQQQAEQFLTATREDLLRTMSAPHGPAGELLNVVELQQRAMRVPHLRKLCKDAEALLAERRSVVTERQQAYLEAQRAREIVDALLKQRTEMEQHRKDRHDTKVSEDLFLSRLVRHTDADGSAM